MSARGRATKETCDLVVDGVELSVATVDHRGVLPTIVFLHGFGSTKEDFADIVHHPTLAQHHIFAYDAPGCGETFCRDPSSISIPFLVDTAAAMLDRHGIGKFHLVGHSMGGLTALMLAHSQPDRVLSFVSIEGNVAPEDCFLSRQIVDFREDDAEVFFRGLIQRASEMPFYSCPLYAASLRHKVRVAAVRGIFTSMVALSDHGSLMEKFLKLPCPRLFMYGEQSATPSYLRQLEEGGVGLARIRRSGHFPMYANPIEMWEAIATFLESTDVPEQPNARTQALGLAGRP